MNSVTAVDRMDEYLPGPDLIGRKGRKLPEENRVGTSGDKGNGGSNHAPLDGGDA